MTKRMVLILVLMCGNVAYGYTRIVLSGSATTSFRVIMNVASCSFNATKGDHISTNDHTSNINPQIVIEPKTEECKKACVMSIAAGQHGVATFGSAGACGEVYFAAGQKKGDHSYGIVAATSAGDFASKMANDKEGIML